MDNEKNWYPKYPSIHVSKENGYPCIHISMYPSIHDIQVSNYPSIQKKLVSKISKYPDIKKKWYPSIPTSSILTAVISDSNDLSFKFSSFCREIKFLGSCCNWLMLLSSEGVCRISLSICSTEGVKKESSSCFEKLERIDCNFFRSKNWHQLEIRNSSRQ